MLGLLICPLGVYDKGALGGDGATKQKESGAQKPAQQHPLHVSHSTVWHPPVTGLSL